MAEFVLKREDVSNPNSALNDKACWKRGDIIAVLPDGATLKKPWLTVIKIPGLSIEEAEFFVKRVMEPDDGFLKKRSKFLIPSNFMDTIFPGNTTVKVFTLAQWNAFKSNIATKL